MPILKFGKYQGHDTSEVPDDYIEFMIKNSQDNLAMWQLELSRRRSKVDNSFMSRIVKRGFDELLKELPFTDHAKLQQARDLLNEGIENAARKDK